ncbi:MAG: hypothetical protein EOO35_00455 [Cyanobacteriota bacterium]|nr:MAG: hypothetical protein EOO35_00455 [Cyanobacteriota bacterium]
MLCIEDSAFCFVFLPLVFLLCKKTRGKKTKQNGKKMLTFFGSKASPKLSLHSQTKGLVQ